jgi:hypothetical protein
MSWMEPLSHHVAIGTTYSAYRLENPSKLDWCGSSSDRNLPGCRYPAINTRTDAPRQYGARLGFIESHLHAKEGGPA